MNTPLLLTFPEYRIQTERLGTATGLPWAEVDLHHFPDGESRIRLPVSLPDEIIFVRSLDHPNDKLVELLLATAGARRAGVEKVSLVAPYLCYMRQDKAFHPGEVVSQKIVGAWLAEHFDALLTVDAHLHRVSSLAEAVPAKHAVNVTATAPMAAFLAERFDDPLIVGPDSESRQWVAAIAAKDGFDYAVGEKQRYSDREVQITLPALDFHGRDIVIVDDVASTGRTLLEAARQLKAHQPASLSVLVTHALFIGDAIEQLQQAGVGNIWSCDAIPHPTNIVSLAGLLAAHLDFR